MKHYTGIDLKRVKEAMVVPEKDETKEDIECELRLIFHEHACTSHLQFFPLLITHFFLAHASFARIPSTTTLFLGFANFLSLLHAACNP